MTKALLAECEYKTMHHIWPCLSSWYHRHNYFSCFLIFALAAALFLYLQATPTFADPDSFYHAKMAILTGEKGVITDFPWLEKFTVLGDYYINQHFLYHVLLVPFVSLLQPLLGIKVATVLLASLVVLTFCLVLRALGVKGAAGYGLILLVSNPFTFRMSLAKAPSLSLIFLMIGIYFLWTKRYYWLALLSFFYVWAYGGFSLLLVLTVIYVLISIFNHLVTSRHRYSRITLKKIWRSEECRALLAAGIGMLLGLVINPYFPQNLFFYRSQLIDIGVVNYRNVIGVGGEWYPYEFFDLIPATFMVSIGLVVTIILMIIFWRKQSVHSLSSFFYFLFFLLLTLKSRRYVEYYVPFTTFFIAIALTTSLHGFAWKAWWKKVERFFFEHQIVAMILLVYVLIMLPAIVIKDLQVARQDLEDGLHFQKFEKSMTWLQKNSAAGDLVFHSDWDEFPILFYYNDYNTYIVGLDPTFMYKKNPELHKEWAATTKGERKKDLYPLIHDTFGARYIFLEKDHTAMDKNVRAVPEFELVYEDDEAKIYEVEEKDDFSMK